MTAQRAERDSLDGASNTLPYVAQIKPVRKVYTSDGWVLRAFFSDPTPSPTCEREGHVWSAPRPGLHREVQVRACTRCAKRGAYVFLTEGAA